MAKQIVNQKNNLLPKRLNKVFSQHKAIEEQFVTPKNVGGKKNHFSQQNKVWKICFGGNFFFDKSLF